MDYGVFNMLSGLSARVYTQEALEASFMLRGALLVGGEGFCRSKKKGGRWTSRTVNSWLQIYILKRQLSHERHTIVK